jgi:hypothetical protein
MLQVFYKSWKKIFTADQSESVFLRSIFFGCKAKKLFLKEKYRKLSGQLKAASVCRVALMPPGK